MKIIITKKHCENARYGNNYDCPLFRAIREQYPEFPLAWVGGRFIRSKNGSFRHFDDINWNSIKMSQIINGKIDQVELEIN